MFEKLEKKKKNRQIFENFWSANFVKTEGFLRIRSDYEEFLRIRGNRQHKIL